MRLIYNLLKVNSLILIFVVSVRGTTFICTLHIHIAAITTIITHDLLPSGLEARLVERRTIKSGGREFESRRGQICFPLPRAVSHFHIRANTQKQFHGFK